MAGHRFVNARDRRTARTATGIPPVFFTLGCCMILFMKRDDVLAKLKEAEAELKARGVTHAALFGSVARGEERSDSDIDIMVEIDPAAVVGVYAYVSLVRSITDMFPVRVDVSNRAALKYDVRPSAERDAIYAF